MPLGNHPKYLGWADTGSAPSPFHSRAKCLRLRWNFTLELGRIQGSGYLLPYRLVVHVLRAKAPQGSLQGWEVAATPGRWAVRLHPCWRSRGIQRTITLILN